MLQLPGGGVHQLPGALLGGGGTFLVGAAPAWGGILGMMLVQGVLEDIRRKKLKVVPQCPFVATYIRRHPEWTDLVLTAENK